MTLRAPLDPLRCTNPDCTLPEGGRCARISELDDPETECPDLEREAEETAPESPDGDTSTTSSVPWSGRHLNRTEANLLLSDTTARIITVLGSYGVGKTCLITSFFLQLASPDRGALPYRFAASRTLYGFRELCDRASAWSGATDDDIVDHTPRWGDDNPHSLLHVGLRPQSDGDDRVVNVLLADLPGETVDAWAGTENPDIRAGLFVDRADGVIVVVDAAALLAAGGRKHATRMASVIRRLAEERSSARAPAVALVFSKVDLIREDWPDPWPTGSDRGAWGSLGRRGTALFTALRHLESLGWAVATYGVSSFPNTLSAGQPLRVMEPFRWLLAQVDRRVPRPRILVGPSADGDSFSALHCRTPAHES